MYESILKQYKDSVEKGLSFENLQQLINIHKSNYSTITYEVILRDKKFGGK